MTAIATQSNEAPAKVAPRRASSAAPSLFVWSEVCLALITIVTIAGMWRLFVDRSYFVPLALHAVAAHVLAATLRRRGVSLVLSGIAVAGAALVALCWGHLWSTTALGLPTGETLRETGDRLADAWRAFGDIKAPAPVLPGFVVASGALVWAIAWAADVAAFRLWAPFEALIPTGSLFVFASVFAADDGRVLAAALWLAAALGFILVHRIARQQSSPSWLGSDPRDGSYALLRTGALLGIVAVLLGVLSGPNLPGAGAVPLIGPDTFDDDASRRTISPFVEISARLRDRPEQEVFSVVAGAGRYWRLTGLDLFDGNTWSSSGQFGDVDDDLGALTGADDAPLVTQQFTITALDGIWLPAAYEPRQLDVGDDTPVRWEADSSTLIVANSVESSDGLEYTVRSAVPAYDPAFLRAASGHIPRSISIPGTDLPDDFPTSVIAEARRVVADADTPYDTALALQTYFRAGAFTYNERPPSGTLATPIESFLFETRTGFCQQFAGTYAAMARAIGLPARVAVGFTRGDSDPNEPGRFIVLGKYAHAWPEVYIAGVGWLPFEPTPGRGNPAAASYTLVPEQQAGDPSPGGGIGTTQTTTQLTDIPGQIGGEATSPGEGASTTITLPTIGATADEGVDGRDILRVVGWSIAAVAGVSLLIVLVGLSIASTRLARRARRRARAGIPVLNRSTSSRPFEPETDGARGSHRRRSGSAEDRVRVAWAEAVESVEVLGITPRRHETPLEFARRLSAAVVGESRPGPLARLVERADFAPDGVSEVQAAQAIELAHGIRADVRRQTTAMQRLLALVDPRPPERRHRARPRPTGPRIQIGPELLAERM